MEFKLNQQIGQLKIVSYSKQKKTYKLECTCGKTCEGSSSMLTRKIGNLLTDGHASCKTCANLYRASVKDNNDQLIVNKARYKEYVNSAKKRNVSWDLSFEHACTLFSDVCYYCGEAPYQYRKGKGEVLYTGIDRKDNNIGYTITNVVSCCKKCNTAKLDMSEKDFFNLISKIYKNRVQRLERKLVDSSESK